MTRPLVTHNTSCLFALLLLENLVHRLAANDFLNLFKDLGKVDERHMSDTLLLAIGLQIRVTVHHSLGEQQVGVLGGRQVGDTVTAKE